VPEVRDSELPHAPHRLLQLALDVVLLDQRADALLELLDGPPRANPPHVHDPRRAPVLVEQPLDESRNLPPTARVNQPPRHERDEDGGEHIVGDGTRDEVGKHRAHGRRVQRKVVDTPQGTDEALKELLAAVDPGQSRQQHARHLPLSVLLLEREHQDPLDHLVPEPRVLERRQLVLRLPALRVGKKVVQHRPHLPLESRDGQRQLQVAADELLYFGTALRPRHKRRRREERLGDGLVLEEVGDDGSHVFYSLGYVDQQVVELLEEEVDARLRLRALDGAALHQRRDERAQHVALPGGLVHADRQDLANQLGRQVPGAELLNALSRVPPALADQVLLRDEDRVHVHRLDRQRRAAALLGLALHRLLEGG